MTDESDPIQDSQDRPATEPTLFSKEHDQEDTGELSNIEDVMWNEVSLSGDELDATAVVEPSSSATDSPTPDESETLELAANQPESFTEDVISIDSNPRTENVNERDVQSWTTKRRGSRRSAGGPESEDWTTTPTSLDDFTSEDYVAATTTEYQGLAEDVRKLELQTHEQQAVYATIPGMDSGIVGFEDVTGKKESRDPIEKPPSDLTARLITGTLLIGVFLAAVFAGRGWLAIFITVIAVMGLGELYAASRRVGYVPVAAFGLIGVIVTAVSGWFAGPGGIAGAIVALTMVVLLWYSVLVREDPLRNAAITVFGLMWVGGLLAFAVAMSRSENYRSLVVGLVSVAAAMDIGAYFVGRSVGKRKLAPKLSPKKTVEGLVGGALSAVAVAVVLVQFEWFDPITTSGSFLIAAGVIAAAPIGDLAESMVKRSFGIKDMGSALPGHGGILDRIDALLFVVPVGYYVYDILGYLG